MKRICFLGLFVPLLISLGTISEARSIFGARIGFHSTALTEGFSMEDFNSSPAWGGFGGIFLNPYYGKEISLRMELLFSSKGNEDINLTYLEFPVMANISFAKIGFIGIGGYAGFLISSNGGGNPSTGDFGFVMDIGIEKTGFQVGLRLERGLTDVIDYRQIFSFGGFAPPIRGDQITVKNRALQIFFGYRF